MENLIALDIRPVTWSKVLFYNDIGKEEIELNKLERFIISQNRVVTSTCTKSPKNKNYDIKFKFKKIEEIKICLDLEKDFTYLNKYFGIDLLESIDDIKNDKVLLFENIKNKILNFELLDTTNKFKLRLTFNGNSHSLVIPNCVRSSNHNFKYGSNSFLRTYNSNNLPFEPRPFVFTFSGVLYNEPKITFSSSK